MKECMKKLLLYVLAGTAVIIALFYLFVMIRAYT